ncbi:Eukaryotic translation initiation factor 4B2 like [Actinidia chinensis var. chinensis]|uniref:Eukaryotic translation initiation factor 4B2 like n=1 Tax=Actinidia chinensis var. chinensis TaxID=1590841 RepID=A0A2R6P3E9_ACTCC|nr:Eukaryotic translation initiation factor 4B2 like [Actinidia chinensis var. chinensis]
MSKPWGKIGAWAADAEQAEAEEREQAAAAVSAAASASGGGGDPQSFPSLREAAASKQQKKKRMSLQEFTMAGAAVHGGGGHRGLTPDEMLRLPTGPKERSAEEMQYGRLGGGFSNYGRSGGGPPGRTGDGDSSGGGGGRRPYGGFDDDRRGPPPRRDSDFDQPSRADEADNWATGKKLSVPSVDSGRSGRYGSLGGGNMGMSRADDADNWGTMKKPIPSRSSNFGSGFGDSRPSSFGSGFGDSRPESDRWTRGGVGDGDRERPRLVLDPPRGEGVVVESVKTNKANPFGTARPREEVLAEKGLDWKKLDMEIEAKKTSRPSSSQSSRPSSAQSSRSEGIALQGTVEGTVVKPRLKVNPFGDAKPREVLLQEKGMDWRKIDLQLEHRGVDRPETEAEKILKEEINILKMEFEKECSSHANRESLEGSGEDQSSLNDLIRSKERDLELLIRELDDKVRFGQKGIERPGSGAGRVSSFPERSPSQSGAFEESRSTDFMERPRSRGTVDMWPRQGDDRRSFQGGRERGFLGNRDMDRPSSRDRW